MGVTHEVSRLRGELAALEAENEHLKEMLSEMADALYASGRQLNLQIELEHLVIKWIHRANCASLRALVAEKALHQIVEFYCGNE